MKRRHELICRAEFDKCLTVCYPSNLFRWEEPAQDSPDWYLETEGFCFAVEATSFAEIIALAGSPLPSAAIFVSLAAFVDDVEKSARELDVLSGSYLVELCPIPSLQQHRATLQARFLKYISDTQAVRSAPALDLGYVGNQQLSIQKIGSTRDYVTETISLEVKSGAQAQLELEGYLDSALANKKCKLRKVQEPLILLVLDDFHYSHIADWRSAVASSPNRSAFTATVRISPASGSSAIWPDRDDWLSLHS